MLTDHPVNPVHPDLGIECRSTASRHDEFVVSWPEIFESMNIGLPNQITAANAGERIGFAGKSRVGRSLWPGVAEFYR